MLCQLLDGLENLVVIGHFSLGANFFDGTTVAGAEGVDTIKRLDVEVIGNGHFDNRVSISRICMERKVPPISRY